MEIFIYVRGPLKSEINEMEDALDSPLRGSGEVTGSGTGQAGSNLDVFINAGALSEGDALLLIRQSLVEFELPSATKIVIDGIEHTLG